MGRTRPSPAEGHVARLTANGENGLLVIIRQLARAQTLEQIMAAVSHGVRTQLQADGATFILREGDRCHYAEEDAISPLWKGRRFPLGACISGWCMANNRSVAIPDIYRDPRIPTDAYRPTFVRSLAMAPVRRDEPVAALGAYWSEGRQPTPEEMERLQAIADAAALAVANLHPRRAGPHRRRAVIRPAFLRAGETKQSAGPERGALRSFVDRIRTKGLRPSSLEACAFAVFCVAVATLVRMAATASGAHGLVPYATYYPAVLIAMLVGGRLAGVLATALGGFAGYWFFMPPLHVIVPLTASDGLNLALYTISCGLIVLIIDGYKRAVLRLSREDAQHLTLAREQHHRIRNAAAVVEAIVTLSLRDHPERAKAINRRIRAGLAEVDIQDQGARRPIRVRDLLTAELQPYDLGRFTLDGEDDTSLPARAGGILTLAVHELTTNALKYGALSAPEGRVSLAWRRIDGRITIRWRETGGPTVTPPQRRGYGSIMVRRLIEAAGGALAMDFQPRGVTAEISFALEPGCG